MTTTEPTTTEPPVGGAVQCATFTELRKAWADKPAGLMRHVDRIEELLEYSDEGRERDRVEAFLVGKLQSEIETGYPYHDIDSALEWMAGFGSRERPRELRELVADLPEASYFEGHLVELLAVILGTPAETSARERRALSLLIEFWECVRRADDHDWEILEGAVSRLCSATEQTGRESYDWETPHAEREVDR